MRGRPRQPTKLLELKGAFKRNPQRKRLSEPVPEREIGGPPGYFSAAQKKCWAEIVENAPPRVLGNSDRVIVEVAARLLAKFRGQAKFMANKIFMPYSEKELAILVSCLARLGMSPADRSRVQQLPEREHNPFDELGTEQTAQAQRIQ